MRRGRPTLDMNSRASPSTTLLSFDCVATTCIYTAFYCTKSKNPCACSIEPGCTLVLSLSLPCIKFSFVMNSILHLSALSIHTPPPYLQSHACVLTVTFHCACPNVVAFVLFCASIPSHELFSTFAPSCTLSHASALPHFCAHN